MRHQVLPATSQDVACLATMLEDAPGYLDWPEKEPSDRLLEACAFSTQIWAARRLSDDSTSALWGVTPRLDNPDVGFPLDAGIRHIRRGFERIRDAVPARVRRDAPPVSTNRAAHRRPQRSYDRSTARPRLHDRPCLPAGRITRQPAPRMAGIRTAPPPVESSERNDDSLTASQIRKIESPTAISGVGLE